jgi:hypothetical protein
MLGFDEACFASQGYTPFRSPELAATKADAEAAMLDMAHHISERLLGEAAPKEATLTGQLAAMHHVETDQAATRACYEVFQTLPEVIALINAPVFLDAARRAGLKRPVAGTNPLVRLDRPGDTRFTTPLHQDYWYSLLSERAVVIWMAIGPLDADMGPVELLAGSHTSGLARFKPYQAGNEWFECADPVDDSAAVVALPGPDEAILFDQRLLHRSGYNRSNKVRVTIQLRYNDLEDASSLTSTFTPSLSRHVLTRQAALLKDWGYSDA